MKKLNASKFDSTDKKAEEVFRLSISHYNQSMVKDFCSVQNEHQLETKHMEAVKQAVDSFVDNCPVEGDALIKYSDRLKDEMNRSMSDWNRKFNETIAKNQNSLKDKIVEIKDSYIKVLLF